MLLVLIFLTQPFATATAATIKYDIKDLEALEADGSYREFLEHALDVRPSDRSKHWREMQANMAVTFIKDAIIKKLYRPEILTVVEELSNRPGLKDDALFFMKRADYVLAYLKTCRDQAIELLSSKPELSSKKMASCRKSLWSIWNNTSQKDYYPDFVFALAKENYRMGEANSSWPIIEKALVHPDSQHHCADPAIALALFEKIKIPALEITDKQELKKTIQELAHPECLKVFANQIKAGMIAPSNTKKREFRDVAYRLLDAMDQLTQIEKDLYFTLFILDGPSIGPTFNQAWSNTEQLGQNHKRRDQLLDRLKTYDPLPDGIFTIANSKKTKVVMEFLSKNVPEYLEYYAETCLDFIEGKRPFPNGNPTVGCKQFFSNFEKIVPENNRILSRYYKNKIY